MHEMKEKLKKIGEMKEQLVCIMQTELAKGAQCVNTEEAGAVVDMIKDLAEAEEKCWKAKYYEIVCEQMKKAEEDGETEMPEMPWFWKLPNMKAGYDHWRYPTSGRYAPKGSGTYSARTGYVPPDPMMDMDYDFPGMPPVYFNSRMGYLGEKEMRSDERRMQTAYDRYKNARRHYTESHSQEDRSEMTKEAQMHVVDMAETIRDIWKDATPELRKKMKSDLTSLIGEMG